MSQNRYIGMLKCGGGLSMTIISVFVCIFFNLFITFILFFLFTRFSESLLLSLNNKKKLLICKLISQHKEYPMTNSANIWSPTWLNYGFNKIWRNVKYAPLSDTNDETFPKAITTWSLEYLSYQRYIKGW